MLINIKYLNEDVGKSSSSNKMLANRGTLSHYKSNYMTVFTFDTSSATVGFVVGLSQWTLHKIEHACLERCTSVDQDSWTQNCVEKRQCGMGGTIKDIK